MNSYEIVTMPASRKIDGLVAEFVMEWEALSCGWVDKKNKSIERPEFWQPSENIECAFQVVNYLREKIGTCKFFLIINPKQGNNIRAVFDPLLEDYSFEATAETIPLAICRAALLATVEKK